MTTAEQHRMVAAVSRELGLDQESDPGHTVTDLDDLTTTVTDTVGGPVTDATAHLVGVAAGRAAESSVATHDFTQQIVALARSWSA